MINYREKEEGGKSGSRMIQTFRNLLINIMAFITATHQKRRERRVAAARRAIGANF